MSWFFYLVGGSIAVSLMNMTKKLCDIDSEITDHNSKVQKLLGELIERLKRM